MIIKNPPTLINTWQKQKALLSRICSKQQINCVKTLTPQNTNTWFWGSSSLKYISESFAEKYHKLETEEWSDPEDRDEYIAENIFFVPKIARWSHIHAQAKMPSIGQTLDEAMEAIEADKELKNVLPQVYGKANLDKTTLGELIDLISNTELQVENENSKDLFGQVYDIVVNG